MKKTVLMIAILLMGASVPAMAESQIHNPYATDVTGSPYNNVVVVPQSAVKNRRSHSKHYGRNTAAYSLNPNTYMTYPGREQYGQNYGPIPRHPGDYRDAVDRGAWSAGGGGIGGAGNRSFDIR